MNNIRKAAALDISILLPYGKTMLFVLLLPTAFAAINRSLSAGVSFAVSFAAMTAGYTFSIMEKNDMERLYGILPVKKSDLVIGRYILMIAQGCLTILLSLAVQPALLRLMGEKVGQAEIALSAAIGIFLFALYTACQLPGYYKYGAVKGRIFIFFPTGIFILLLLIFSRKQGDIPEDMPTEALPVSPLLLVIAAAGAAAVMYAVSIAVSVRIMENKEM